jgi:hypothetical protein
MTNSQTPDCAICRIGGGVGNIAYNLERASVASSTYNIDSCFLYWRHGTPLIGESTLDELFDLKSIKCVKTKFTSINDIQAKQLSDRIGHGRIIPRLVKYLTVIRDSQLSKKTTNIEITTCDPELISQLWREIRSSILVRKIADDFASANITTKTIGVHVRRTDHRAANTVSTNMFFLAIDVLLDANHDKIFLATDDESEEKKFLSRYGKSVVFTDKSTKYRWDTPGRRRNLVTLDTYKEAFVDMLVLGHCGVIFGSLGSSFSTCSVKLSSNKPELIIVG